MFSDLSANGILLSACQYLAKHFCISHVIGMAGFLYLLYFHFQPRNVKVKSAKLKKKMIFVGYIHEFDAFLTESIQVKFEVIHNLSGH